MDFVCPMSFIFERLLTTTCRYKPPSGVIIYLFSFPPGVLSSFAHLWSLSDAGMETLAASGAGAKEYEGRTLDAIRGKIQLYLEDILPMLCVF